MDASPVLASILGLLEGNRIEHRVVEHGPTRTSEESAAARGESLEVGGKALLLKVGDSFGLFVLSAASKLDSGALKKHFKAKKTRFANCEELDELTGLEPGSVPPFGPPLFELPLYVDRALLANDRIAFNAGSLETSVVMGMQDYLALAKPEVIDFSK